MQGGSRHRTVRVVWLLVAGAAVALLGVAVCIASGVLITGQGSTPSVPPAPGHEPAAGQGSAHAPAASVTPEVATALAAAPAPMPSRPARGQALSAASSFLQHYELRSGRVVRWDQGGDTVSEGEAYAMLLSVASGNRARFDAAWSWTSSHLLLPSGLLAWHWANGRVASSEPATDADVDAAYALDLAAGRFHEPGDLSAAETMAAAIVNQESITAPTGRLLVAGPWAIDPPSSANPSYGSPAELTALGGLDPTGAPFAALAAGSRAVVEGLLAANRLPPDWVLLQNGQAVVTAPPGQEASDGYGFDAVRLPIRWAASCVASDRHSAARLWPVLRSPALAGRATVDLTVSGAQGRDALRSPVGLVAAAAAAWAAHHRDIARELLGRAEAMNRVHQTYYSSAWVALGRMFLQTRQLGTCGGA